MTSPIEAWTYALAALQTEADGGTHGLLGGCAEAIERCPAHLDRLRAAYGVETEAQLLSVLQGHVGARQPLDFGVPQADLAPLLGPHRDVLQRAGGAAWHAHHAVVAAGLGLLAGLVDLARLSPFLNQAAASARRAYDSWETYGRHVLLGEAAHTGRWDRRLARAFDRLLDDPRSPWRTHGWAEYRPPEPGLVAMWFRAQARCARCEGWTPVVRLGADARCASCLAPVELPPPSWRFLGRVLEALRWWPEGLTWQRDNFETDARHWYTCGVAWPRCECGAPLPAPPGEAEGPTGSLSLACGACGRAVSARAPDGLLRELFPDALCVLGEHEAASAVALVPSSVVLACESCGAPQTPVPDARSIHCEYCGRVAQLPDELWARLHPRPPLVTITVVSASVPPNAVVIGQAPP